MQNEIGLFYKGLHVEQATDAEKQALTTLCQQDLVKLRTDQNSFAKFAKNLQELLGEQDIVTFAYEQEARGTVININNPKTKDRLELSGPTLHKPIFVARKYTPDKTTPTIATFQKHEAAAILKAIFFPDAANSRPTT